MNRVNNEDLDFDLPQFIFSHTNTSIIVKFKNPVHDKLVANNYKLHFIVNGNDQLVEFDKNGVGTLTTTFASDNKLSVYLENVAYNAQIPVISIWYMLLPLAGLLFFLVYKIAFGKKVGTLSISKKEVTEKKINFPANAKFKIVNIRATEEEEILV